MANQPRGFRKAAIGVAIGLGLLPATPLSAQIAQVGYSTLTGTQFVPIDSVPGGSGAGTNYDGLLPIGGVLFGEHFSGQTVTASGNFDQLGGAPSAGLNLLPGEAGHNLVVFQSPAGPVLSGLGTLGYPASDAIGEGAVSLLFTSDQSEFGFRLTGGNGGNAFVSFFRGDGSLIQSFTLAGLPLISTYGFAREGGVHDIRGVSISNDDVTGLGLAGLRHDVASGVPEPASWAMLILGFGMIGGMMRRQRLGSGPPQMLAKRGAA